METQAWKSCSFDYPEHVPAMIAPEEKQYLYWLGAKVWRGRGDVVEFGPWLGGSTVCLAAGMRDSRHDARGRLAVFDNFLWRSFMAERVDLALAPGDSFEPHFRAHVAPFGEIVVSHARALPDEEISGDHDASVRRFAEAQDAAVPLFDGGVAGPVEILFIDGAKSWRGMRHLLCVIGDALETGSLLVCQDFKHWGAYWVPVMMARLGRHLRPVHDVTSASTVTFEVTAPIPRSTLTALEDHVSDLSTESTLAAIARAASWLEEAGDTAGSSRVRLSRVRFLAHQGQVEAAVEAFLEEQAGWPVGASTEPLDRARHYLRVEKGVALAPPERARVSWLRRAVRFVRGRRARP